MDSAKATEGSKPGHICDAFTHELWCSEDRPCAYNAPPLGAQQAQSEDATPDSNVLAARLELFADTFEKVNEYTDAVLYLRDAAFLLRRSGHLTISADSAIFIKPSSREGYMSVNLYAEDGSEVKMRVPANVYDALQLAMLGGDEYHRRKTIQANDPIPEDEIRVSDEARAAAESVVGYSLKIQPPKSER